MHVDYLVVGSGASALAFVDSLVAETEATVAMVDRRHVPGGHWNDAYPFVRLHQPSAFYGVASTPLGRDRLDTTGPNRGLHELATGVEVTAYFHSVLEDVLIPTGRVHYLPTTEYRPDGTVVSLLSGRPVDVTWDRLVDATFLTTTIPLTHEPSFTVDPDVTCVPPNHLPRLAHAHDAVTILGGGKTAMDTVLWLLGHDYPADAITWIVPRDSWLMNRARIQPGWDFFEATVSGLAEQTEACAEATDVADLGHRMEACGVWIRLDPEVEPTMYHAATMAEAELDQLRRVDNVVRAGRVSRIEPHRLVVDHGEVACTPGTLHVDCTASAAANNINDRTPVFTEASINLQMLRPYQPCFSAALIARIEATIEPEGRADLTRPTPMSDTVEDWLTIQADGLLNAGAWGSRPEIAEWQTSCRLDGFGAMLSAVGPDDAERMALLGRLLTAVPDAVVNLQRLAAETGAEAA